MGNYRWRIVALLFFATTINYIDRQVMGILAPVLQEKFNWSEADYGFIIASFQAAYALGLLITGRVLDKIGVKVGYSVAIVLWSLAGMAHAWARGVFSFGLSRFFLGLGESANFPAAIKTVTEWFPKKERAFATGLFNSGSNIGAIVAPLAVPWIAITWGWQWAFIITGLLGFIWLLFWIPFYHQPSMHCKLKKEELSYILQDNEKNESVKVPWIKLIGYKQVAGIMLVKFLTDPVWWFFLYWLPKYLSSNYDFNLSTIGLPLIIIYLVSDGGSIFGGWLSSFLVKKGYDPIKARKRTILSLALFVLPVFYLTFHPDVWVVILLISVATASHQGISANIFTLISDTVPKHLVGSVTGMAGFSGAVGGIIFSTAVGFILELTGSYHLLFGFASVTYLLAWLVLAGMVKKQIKH